jgi:hypothetical protein
LSLNLEKANSYIKAGILLHAMTLIEITLFDFLFIRFAIFQWISDGNSLIKFVTVISFVILPIIAQLDARSRFQNYKLVKDYLWQYGFEPKIIKLFIRSRCQRDAVLTAASELGMNKQCKTFFRKHGYKWYHFFPDKIFSKPGFLFTKHFWSQTLFAKTYRPKINFREIHLNNQKTKQPPRKMAIKIFSEFNTN